MKKLYFLLLPLLLFACGHDENGMEPEPVQEPTTVEPTTEVNPFDPVEEDGAPMKVMRLKKEDFLKLFVGKKWIQGNLMEISKKGVFANVIALGVTTRNLYADSDSTIYSWGLNSADVVDTLRMKFDYDDKTGTLSFSSGLPLNVALVNEECLIMYQKSSAAISDYLFNIYQNEDKTVVHQPVQRQDAGIFPFKTDALDKDLFKEIVSNKLWVPCFTLGIYDDGTVALTGTALNSTRLYFGPDGVMREFFRDNHKWWVHKCPYDFDDETALLTYHDGRAPSIFRDYDDKVLALTAYESREWSSMIGLVLDTHGKTKFGKIVYILMGVNVSNVLDYEKKAVEVDFDQ